MPLLQLTRELVEEIAQEFPQLQSCNLSHNAIQRLENLDLLPFLSRLDLSHNQIQQLPPQLPLWLPCLEFLNLSHNHIESLQYLSDCDRLVTLDVGMNRIELFSELRFLQPLTQLQALVLEGNPISHSATYRREVLTMLPQLQSLDKREITPAERLYAKLQRKNQLHIAAPTQEPHIPTMTTPALLSHPSTNASLSLSPDATRAELTIAPEALSVTTSPRLLTPDSLHSHQNQQHKSIHHNAPENASPFIADDCRTSHHANLSVETVKTAPSHNNPSTALSVAPSSPRIELEKSHQSTINLKPAKLSNSNHWSKEIQVIGSPINNDHHQLPHHQDNQFQLLQHRVAALESILSIHDKTLQQDLARMGTVTETFEKDNRLTFVSVDKAAEMYVRMLATWRETVMALMVQIKAKELQRSDHDRRYQQQIREMVEVQSRIEQKCELWKQKAIDVEAQRDFERARVLQTQELCTIADTKVVQAVRTVAVERDQLRRMAETVAFFSASDGVMVNKMEQVRESVLRLEAFEKRLLFLRERLETAIHLVAHREARLRNSQAAMDAERRIWNHKLERMKEKYKDNYLMNASLHNEQSENDNSGAKKLHATWKTLRPITETAFRALFHRLDAYGAGIVRTKVLLDALRTDLGMLDAVGGQAKLDKLVDHVESEIRKQSIYGTLGGNITWGEVLLFFMPASTYTSKDQHNNEQLNHHVVMTEEWLPPVFGASYIHQPAQEQTTTENASCSNKGFSMKHMRQEKRQLAGLSREELIEIVVSLREDRNQLRKRVLEDARDLQRRAIGIQSEWKAKVDELVEKNGELQRVLAKQNAETDALKTKLAEMERNHGDAQQQLQSLRRQMQMRESEFTRTKEELESQREECVQRERDIWQKELDDMGFSHSVLKAEKTKQDLLIRQLERELTKKDEQLVAQESRKVELLEDKVRKRDGDLAKLRRERNTLLNSLREYERKLALQPVIVSQTVATQTENVSFKLPKPKLHSVACQTMAQTAPTTKKVPRRDVRMSLDEISHPSEQHSPEETKSSTQQTRRLSSQAVSARLQQLQSLTESLLAD